MRYFVFAKTLNFYNKIVYFIGIICDKLLNRNKKYLLLKIEHSILSQIERMPGILNISFKKNYCVVKSQESEVYLRFNQCDLKVFNQIFILNEYYGVIEIWKQFFNLSPAKVIFDLGANIGISALYFLKYFPHAKVIALEPDQNNFNFLKKNLAGYPNSNLENKAIWYDDIKLSINHNFRDGASWASSVSECNNVSKELALGITMKSLMGLYDIDEIDILKIDIEGSEFKIFSEKNDLFFMHKTKVLAIEIHEEVGDRAYIHEILKKYNFYYFTSNETTFAINKKYIN